MIKSIQPSEVDEKDIVSSEMDIEGLDEFRRVPSSHGAILLEY